MEKYGVEQDVQTPGGPKTAQAADRCKKCGKTLRPRTETGVLLCPDCGSRPYEG